MDWEFVIYTYRVQGQRIHKEWHRNKQQWGTFLSERNGDRRKHQEYVLNHNYSHEIIFKARKNCINVSRVEASDFVYLETRTSLFTINTDKGFWNRHESQYSSLILTLNIAFSESAYIHNLNGKITA